MSNIELFRHDDWNVRVVDVDGEPWFIAAGVCEALGLSNTAQALKALDFLRRKLNGDDTLALSG